jgi:hypothetical protein
MPSKLPRALCPVCDRPITLTLAGRLRVHGSKQPGVWPPENCAGSGRAPKTNDDKEN